MYTYSYSEFKVILAQSLFNFLSIFHELACTIELLTTWKVRRGGGKGVEESVEVLARTNSQRLIALPMDL